jgi:hypothetical protein
MDELERLRREAISAIKAGDQARGRFLLAKLLLKRPDDTTAWLWLSAVVKGQKAKIRCLMQALRTDPANRPARRGLREFGYAVHFPEGRKPERDGAPAREAAKAQPDEGPAPDTTPLPQGPQSRPDQEPPPLDVSLFEGAAAQPDEEPAPDTTPLPEGPRPQPALPGVSLPETAAAQPDEELVSGATPLPGGPLPPPDQEPPPLSGRPSILPTVILILAATIVLLVCVLLATLLAPELRRLGPTPTPTSISDNGDSDRGTRRVLGYQILYDFVDQAPTAAWIFYTPCPYRKTYAEVSGYSTTYTLGSAHLWPTAKLEDGMPVYRVLEARPPATPSGEIWGEYDLSHVPLQAGDRFYAEVGFLEGAYRGDVNFRVHFQSGEPGAPVETIASLKDRYDWQEGSVDKIKEWEVVLPTDLGAGIVYLEVDSNLTVYQDRAVWIRAEIRRPVSD